MKRGLMVALALLLGLTGCGPAGGGGILVAGPNTPPVAAWIARQGPEDAPYVRHFQADSTVNEASYDPDGEIVAYIWHINGETFRQPRVTYTFPQAGEYAVSLTVIDDDNAATTLEAYGGSFSVRH